MGARVGAVGSRVGLLGTEEGLRVGVVGRTVDRGEGLAVGKRTGTGVGAVACSASKLATL